MLAVCNTMPMLEDMEVESALNGFEKFQFLSFNTKQMLTLLTAIRMSKVEW